MPPTRPNKPPPPVQLRFATGDPEPAAVDLALNKTGLHLLAIRDACQLLHDVAARRVTLDADTLDDLRHALNTLDAAGPLPGRLGYLTKQINTGPLRDYDHLVDDLAFAVHLTDPGAQ